MFSKNVSGLRVEVALQDCSVSRPRVHTCMLKVPGHHGLEELTQARNCRRTESAAPGIQLSGGEVAAYEMWSPTTPATSKHRRRH